MFFVLKKNNNKKFKNFLKIFKYFFPEKKSHLIFYF